MCIRPWPLPGFPLHCTTDTRLVPGCSYQLWTFFSDLPSYGSIIRYPDQTKGNLPASLHGLTLTQSVTYVVISVGYSIFRHPVHGIFQRRRAVGLLKLYTYNVTARFTQMPLDRLLYSSMRPKMHLNALRAIPLWAWTCQGWLAIWGNTETLSLALRAERFLLEHRGPCHITISPFYK